MGKEYVFIKSDSSSQTNYDIVYNESGEITLSESTIIKEKKNKDSEFLNFTIKQHVNLVRSESWFIMLVDLPVILVIGLLSLAKFTETSVYLYFQDAIRESVLQRFTVLEGYDVTPLKCLSSVVIYWVLSSLYAMTDCLILESVLLLPDLGIQSQSKVYHRTIWGLIKCLFASAVRGVDSNVKEGVNYENGDEEYERLGYTVTTDEKQFTFMGNVSELLINEGFRKFSVIYYLVLLVKKDDVDPGSSVLLVLFPRLLPRLKYLEIVRRDVKRYIR